MRRRVTIGDATETVCTMTSRDWNDDDVSSATDPDAVLRQERIALAAWDAKMRAARAKFKMASGAHSMREMKRLQHAPRSKKKP